MFLVDITYLSKKTQNICHEYVDFDTPVQILKELKFVLDACGPIIAVDFCVED